MNLTRKKNEEEEKKPCEMSLNCVIAVQKVILFYWNTESAIITIVYDTHRCFGTIVDVIYSML